MKGPPKVLAKFKALLTTIFSHFYTTIVKLGMVISDTLGYNIKSKATL